jgi:FKBP12-rapamycin complex-associated protein
MQHRLHDHPHSKAPPNVVYAQLKYLWAKGSAEDSLNFLRQFSASLSADIARETSAQTQRPSVSKEKITELSKLVSRCFLKQGEWQVKLKDDWSEVGPAVFQ